MTDANPYESPDTDSDSTARVVSPRPNRLGWIIGLSLVAILFGGNTPRIVPGGPFVSLTGDILPTIAALTAIRLGLLTLRGRAVIPKLVALFFILISTIAMARVLVDVYSFWHRPYSRGDFFGL